MRSINTLTAVKQSKVILALPNKKHFLKKVGNLQPVLWSELYPGKIFLQNKFRVFDSWWPVLWSLDSDQSQLWMIGKDARANPMTLSLADPVS